MIYIFLIAVVVLVVNFYVFRNKLDNVRLFFERNPYLIKILLLGYIAFASCFSFPIRSEVSPLDFMKVYLLVVCYGTISTSFIGVYGNNCTKKVYLYTIMFTVVGLLWRYLLEFGEVSNTYNFTPVNTAAFLVIMPLYVTIVYYLTVKKFNSSNWAVPWNCFFLW